MAIQVKGYTRHINGKLVTVHGYAAKRAPLYPELNQKQPEVHRENVARPTATAPVGTYIQLSVTRGMGGLTSQAYKPGGPNRDLPTYNWRTNHFPIRNAYVIPKKEKGNPDAYTT